MRRRAIILSNCLLSIYPRCLRPAHISPTTRLCNQKAPKAIGGSRFEGDKKVRAATEQEHTGQKTTSKWRKALLMCGAFVALATLSSFTNEPQQPSYEGRMLSEWLELKMQLPLSPQSDALVIHEALDHFGTNAFPIMLKWVREGGHPWQWRYTSVHLPAWLQKSVYLPLPGRAASEHASLAVTGFRYYQEKGACVVPELLQMVEHGNPCARRALGEMGEGILPELWSGYTNGNHAGRWLILGCLSLKVGREKSISGIEPILRGLLKEKDQEFVGRTLAVLGQAKGEPDLVIPMLGEWIDDERPLVRYNAVSILGSFGPGASMFARKIRSHLSDTNSNTRFAAQFALQQIEPVERSNRTLRIRPTVSPETMSSD